MKFRDSGRVVFWCFLLLVSGAATAQAQVVAVAANDYSPSSEHDNLVATLSNLGFSTVDVMSTSEATAAGACALIVYAAGWDGTGLEQADLQAWVVGGNGLIQIGDWHHFFQNSWQGQLPTPTTADVTISDDAYPIAQGLPASWTGHGYFFYAWPNGGMGNTLGLQGETDVASVAAAGFTTSNYGIAALDTGTGRAVYFGINVYGPDGGANELTLLTNSLAWIGCGTFEATPIPTLGGWGMVLLALLTACTAVLIISGRRVRESHPA